MYKRYCERKKLDVDVLDYQSGDEAESKSVSFIALAKALYLKSERRSSFIV
jgi:protein subunit release factor B